MPEEQRNEEKDEEQEAESATVLPYEKDSSLCHKGGIPASQPSKATSA